MKPSLLRIEISPRTIFLILGAVAGIWLIGQLTTVLIVLTIALVMVGTFDPVVSWLEARGIRRGRALILVFSMVTLVLGAILLLMVPPLVSQLLHLIEDAPKERAALIKSLHSYKWAEPIVQAIKAVPVDNLVVRAGNAVIGYSSDILELLGYAVSTIFLAIYLLADPTRSKGLLYAVVPRHHHLKLARVLLELKIIVGGYMRGQLITSLAIAVFVFVLLTCFGVENALAIALFAGLTDIIPFVGGYIASAPVIVAVSGNGSASIIIVTVLMFLYQEFESRILVPRVYGRVLRLSPAIVLLALLVGGTLAGIVGALLALPIAAGLQMLVRELRVDLPGEISPRDAMLERDERASDLYEQLAEGVPAADAGAIADDLAKIMTNSEHDADTRNMAELASADLATAPVAAPEEPAPPTPPHDVHDARTKRTPVIGSR